MALYRSHSPVNTSRRSLTVWNFVRASCTADASRKLNSFSVSAFCYWTHSSSESYTSSRCALGDGIHLALLLHHGLSVSTFQVRSSCISSSFFTNSSYVEFLLKPRILSLCTPVLFVILSKSLFVRLCLSSSALHCRV